MPVHWHYDTSALRRDYGRVTGYVAPKNPHPDSILWRSSYRPINEKANILHNQSQFWGKKGIHYHQFLAAGENTLDLKLCTLLIESLNANNGYDSDDYLKRYIDFMTTPGSHNDTYDEKLSKEPTIKLAIIGGGLTSTSMLCQLVRQVRTFLQLGHTAPASIHLHVVEKQYIFGPGFAHSDQNAMPFHLINMCARDMSILAADPDDFENWVSHHIHEMKSQLSGISDNETSPDRTCRHYPRPVMGEYLKHRFNQAVHDAKRIGIHVHLHPGCEAIDVSEPGDDRARVTVLDLGSHEQRVIRADRVLLATGHWFYEGKKDGFYPSPWPPRYLEETIPHRADVAIIGTNLSAIDAVLTLTANGSFLRSPSGELLNDPPLTPDG
jgi:hypothetical protein